ncbi:LOB domain-containing protein 1-like isoform X1 [Salvia hispanica]|uniref:LOB domain-containing protein 1-like isoform X1 n=1 Tax=Salvia hispanica TaxID=49212 RepID=UPI0020097541|nr:LOB domain-containing protein 1-like isoform X1 [Salvia hispanica]
MEGSDDISASSPSSSSSPQSAVVLSPCAACKILRRRCVEKCVLAPYFPPHDPLKFSTAHRVFGASNIIKFLQQEVPEGQREDAVSSMVYEANARLREPVYGCAGAIWQLQKQVNDLHQQLAKAQAQLLNMQSQNANLMAIICMDMSSQNYHQHNLATYIIGSTTTSFSDDDDLGFSSEQPLWN